MAVTKFEKSLVVVARLLGVVDALSIRTTEWTLEMLLLEPVTETPPPSTRMPVAALVTVFIETFADAFDAFVASNRLVGDPGVA
jgi:hypothetical protein